MDKFDDLRQKHYQLLSQEANEGQTPLSADAVESYIKEVQSSGGEISDAQERDQLRAILQHWRSRLYQIDPTRGYQPTDLEPYAGPPVRASSRGFYSIGIFLGLLLLAGLVLMGAVLLNQPRGIPVPVANIEATNQVIMTANAATQRAAEWKASKLQTDVAMQVLTETLDYLETVPSPVGKTDTPIPINTPMLLPTFTPASGQVSIRTATVAAVLTQSAQAPVPTPIGQFPPGPYASLDSPVNGDAVLQKFHFQGRYANLRPGWSVLVLLQSLSSAGKYYPLPAAYTLPPNAPTSGAWSITADLADVFPLNKADKFQVFQVVSTTGQLTDQIIAGARSGFSAIPGEAIIFDMAPVVLEHNALNVSPNLYLVYSRFAPSGQGDLYLYDPQTRTNRQITRTEDLSELQPDLSPDGKYIAFVGRQRRSDGTYLYSLHTMTVDGANDQPLVSGSPQDAEIGYPRWSPDKKMILYGKRVKNGAWGIYLYDLAAREERTVLQGPYDNRYPNWLPDGETIVFSGIYSRTGTSGLATINLVTGERTELQDLPGINEMQPFVSPDGRSILFVGYADPGGFHDIFVYRFETNSATRIMERTGSKRCPTWDANGKTIYYLSYANENRFSLWSADVQGQGQKQLIRFPLDDFCFAAGRVDLDSLKRLK